MSQKCPNCGFPFEKKLKNNYSFVLPKKITGSKIVAPRMSMKARNPIRKSKQK